MFTISYLLGGKYLNYENKSIHLSTITYRKKFLTRYYIDDHRLTKMSHKSHILELMGRVIARRVGINFFTCTDVSVCTFL